MNAIFVLAYGSFTAYRRAHGPEILLNPVQNVEKTRLASAAFRSSRPAP